MNETQLKRVEPVYYNAEHNNLLKELPSHEISINGKIKLTDKENTLAKALYEATGPKAKIDDIRAVYNKLKGRLKDPNRGYKKTYHELIGSKYNPLTEPVASYDKDDNAHKAMIQQLAAYVYRKSASAEVLNNVYSNKQDR